MSNTPIFDHLVEEFAQDGKKFENFTKFSAPTFRWPTLRVETSDTVVQLDKPAPPDVINVKPLFRMEQTV